jgi:hypothetical protein
MERKVHMLQPDQPDWKAAIAMLVSWLHGPVLSVRSVGLSAFACVMGDGREIQVRVNDSSSSRTTIEVLSEAEDDEQGDVEEAQ